MLVFLLILIIGGSYLYYRYRLVTDKKRFFNSPLFIAVSGSLGILIFSYISVNITAPETHSARSLISESDSLSIEEADTTYECLLAKNSAFHYNLIRKISKQYRYFDHRSILENKYRAFTLAKDAHTVALGNFCLGVMSMEREENAKAQDYLNSVSDNNLPYLHFCKAVMSMKSHNKVDAGAEYTLELQNKAGNRTPAFLALLELYTTEKNFDKLHELFQYPEADDLFPDNLARMTLLHAGDVLNYALWLGKMLVRRTHAIGFVAAFLIAVMWLVYLFRLDIFKPEKFIYLLALFAGGTLSVPLVFLFTDIVALYTSWSLNGAFFNDLLYSIIMIGLPEELAKALPLLLLLAFTRFLQEPIDYIVYGCASALGFAFIENLLYFEEITGGVIHGRAYLSVIGHMADTSIVAYGFVMTRFQLKNRSALYYVLPLSLFSAGVIHGIYDLLLFQGLIFLFFIFFVLVVQVWLIMINNCMNNSSSFTYAIARKAETSRIFIALCLTAIFAFEYIAVAFSFGADQGNSQLLENTAFAGTLIIFFSSNLGSFDLIKGYWRNVRISHAEKRGYGSRQRVHSLISWYFVNASQSHNYVGLSITISNDPYNKLLANILERPYGGQIINRITLHDGEDEDPHWFLVKMIVPLVTAEVPVDYLLVKLRYSEDSLLYEDEVQVHFRVVTDAGILNEPRPDKKDFPFYGWAYIAISKHASANVTRELKEV